MGIDVKNKVLIDGGTVSFYIYIFFISFYLLGPSYLLFFSFRDDRHGIKVGNAKLGRVSGINIQH